MKENTIRWIALIFTIAGIIFNYFFAAGDTLSVITQKYDSLFVPADYAFAIWGFIYLSVIAYLVYTLSGSQKRLKEHNRLAMMLSLLAVGGMIWIALYTNYQLVLSSVVIVCMMIIALIALKMNYSAIASQKLRKITSIPFGAYAAWLMVASISNLSFVFKSEQWPEEIFSEPVWAIIMLSLASLIAIIVSWKYRTIIFAAVIAWATVAIWRKQENDAVQMAALVVSLVLVAVMIFYLVKPIPRR